MRKDLTASELGWLAGIIDGEGSIFISKHHRKDRDRAYNYRLVVSVQSADRLMARRIFELTEDGTFFSHKVKNPKWSNTFKWQADGKTAIRVLKEILPHMVVKRDQAELAIWFQENTKFHWKLMTPEDYQTQEDCYYKMKEMKTNSLVGKDTIEYFNAKTIDKTGSDFRACLPKSTDWREFRTEQTKEVNKDA